MTYAELKQIMGEFITITKLGDIRAEAPGDLEVPEHVLVRLGVVDNVSSGVDATSPQPLDVHSIPLQG